MIERLIRFILDAEGIFDMENISGDTFKTLKSIIENNEDQMMSVFGIEFGDELLYYLKETYFDSGIRNTIMHYNKKSKIKPKDCIIAAKYFFLKLIEFYVERYCK